MNLVTVDSGVLGQYITVKFSTTKRFISPQNFAVNYLEYLRTTLPVKATKLYLLKA